MFLQFSIFFHVLFYKYIELSGSLPAGSRVIRLLLAPAIGNLQVRRIWRISWKKVWHYFNYYFGISGNVKDKNETLERLILMLLNGDKVSPSILMYVIRFCLPSIDHRLKKNLLLFWEVVPKVTYYHCHMKQEVQTNPQGKLLHEMILVCDAYRKDLQHPNEFVRGSTLRFIIMFAEVILYLDFCVNSKNQNYWSH